MARAFRKAFDHIGIPTAEPQPGESWVEFSQVWVTNPRAHPQRLEYLRPKAVPPVKRMIECLLVARTPKAAPAPNRLRPISSRRVGPKWGDIAGVRYDWYSALAEA